MGFAIIDHHKTGNSKQFLFVMKRRREFIGEESHATCFKLLYALEWPFFNHLHHHFSLIIIFQRLLWLHHSSVTRF